MKTPERAWKRAADNAISPVHYTRERERLATSLAATLDSQQPDWQPGICARNLPSLEDLTASLTQAQVTASLANTHLELLAEARDSADYEDVLNLEKELAWARTYLSGLIQTSAVDCPKTETARLADSVFVLYQRKAKHT